MVDFEAFSALRLRGGVILVRVALARAQMVDAIGRPALARTVIVGPRLYIQLSETMSDEEISVSLYHEVLEGAMMAAERAPSPIEDFNEADFEAAAWRMHHRFGPATPETLNRMLEKFGFESNLSP